MTWSIRVLDQIVTIDDHLSEEVCGVMYLGINLTYNSQ